MNIFYRVGDRHTQQGLWYSPGGKFEGIIHNSSCKNRQLQMPFDEEIVGWLSVTDNLESLYEWFPKEDILMLQTFDFVIQVYEVDERYDVRFYEPFQHTIVRQSSAKLIGILTLV